MHRKNNIERCIGDDGGSYVGSNGIYGSKIMEMIPLECVRLWMQYGCHGNDDYGSVVVVCVILEEGALVNDGLELESELELELELKDGFRYFL